MALQISETRFKSYRSSFTLTRIFMGWKEHAIQMKLAGLFYKKKILRHWFGYVQMRNHQLPMQYRGRRLKEAFIATLTLELKEKWNEKRSDIIAR